MKATKIFTLLASLALVLTACQDDDFGKKYSPANVGDDIIFGGTSGYVDEGRTQYGDKTETGTEIKWYTGDQVRIYCAQATGGTDNYCDYGVVEVGSSKTSLRSSSGNSLKWGDATTHTFYGVYPSPGQLLGDKTDPESEVASDKLSLNANTLTGFLPNNQTPWGGAVVTEEEYNGSTLYRVQPAMRYAYMTTKSTAQLSAGHASLEFKPIVTAVEIILKNTSWNSYTDIDGNTNEGAVNLSNIEAFSISSSNIICGEFTTDIDNNNATTVLSTDNDYKTVFIPANIEELKYGDYVSFTAFMMLNGEEALKDITVSIITQAGTKVANISRKDSSVIVQAKRKNFIKNIPLNLGSVRKDVSGANWIKHIPDTYTENGATKNTLVKDLSIPGAGGAASANLFPNNKTFAQQSLTIAQQWAQGIRCFEFAVDRAGATSGNANSGLGAEYVLCAGRTTNKTLKNAVDEVVACLDKSPDEFAMVIITYENLGGWGGSTNYSRDPATFMSQLKTFWNNYSSKTALYNPANTTVANARGKLLCIARPTSAYYDDAPSITVGSTRYENVNLAPIDNKLNIATENCHEHILVINGWGSLKDKWEARGYTNNVFERGIASVKVQSGDDKKPGRPFDVASFTCKLDGILGLYGNKYWDGNRPVQSNYTAQVDYVKGQKANFYYKTQSGKNSMTTSANAWVQEWARVSPATNTELMVTEGNPNLDEVSKGDIYRVVYWAPTISEKELRIRQTLDYALDRTQMPDVDIYINSLCGYYISSDHKQSYLPFHKTDYSGANATVRNLSVVSEYSGMEGDIDTYAKYINNYFYNLLLEKKASGKLSGNGCGIVLMDRVSNNNKENAGGYYIPQLIWSNNKFAANTEIDDEEVTPDAQGASEYIIR